MPVCPTVDKTDDLLFRVTRGRKFWKKALYVAKKSLIKTSNEREELIKAEWNRVWERDLGLHMAKILDKIKMMGQRKTTEESFLEAELLLTGDHVNSEGRVSLSPRIWFRCGSTWVEKIVREEMHGLSWMAERDLGNRIETGLESAMLVSNKMDTIPAGIRDYLEAGPESICKLSNGFDMHILVGWQHSGAEDQRELLCSVSLLKRGKLVHHSISRIGGLVTLNIQGRDKIVAVTTAHGLLDYLVSTGSAETTAQPEKSITAFATSLIRNPFKLFKSNKTKNGTSLRARPNMGVCQVRHSNQSHGSQCGRFTVQTG